MRNVQTGGGTGCTATATATVSMAAVKARASTRRHQADMAGTPLLRNHLSLDFGYDIIRVAGHQLLLGAVHQEVEVFQDDRADQAGIALRLHQGAEDTVAALEANVN